jgi:hypothetical protein
MDEGPLKVIVGIVKNGIVKNFETEQSLKFISVARGCLCNLGLLNGGINPLSKNFLLMFIIFIPPP